MNTPIATTRVWHDGIAYDVSTIDRQSSAALAYGATYAETIVFEVLPGGERGNIVHQDEAPTGSIRRHQQIVVTLHECGVSGFSEDAAQQQEKKDAQPAELVADGRIVEPAAPAPAAQGRHQAYDASQQAAPADVQEAEAAAPVKCDGNHGGPRCGDPECWIAGADTRQAPRVLAASNRPTLKLGDINARLAPLSISGAGLAEFGIEPLATDKSAKLYSPAQFSDLLVAIGVRIAKLASEQLEAAQEMEAA